MWPYTKMISTFGNSNGQWVAFQSLIMPPKSRIIYHERELNFKYISFSKFSDLEPNGDEAQQYYLGGMYPNRRIGIWETHATIRCVQKMLSLGFGLSV